MKSASKPIKKENEKQNNNEGEYPKKFILRIDKSQRGLQKLDMKGRELNEELEKIKYVKQLKEEEKKKKDDEIDLLNNEIQKIMLNNYDLETAIQKELELRNKYEYEQLRIANYCNDLKEKFKHVDRTIKDYESTIESMKEENVKLSDTYDYKIEQIDRENKKIAKRIDDRIDVFNNQKAVIIDNESKVEDLLKDIEQQKKNFEDRAAINKIKYDELEKKYAALQKRLSEIQMNSEIRKAENVQSEKKVTVVQSEKSDIEKQIKDYEENNRKLSEQIKGLTQQWKQMRNSSIDEKNKKKSSRFSSTRKSDRTTARTKSNTMRKDFK